MATIIFSAVGAAIGSSLGGAVLGVSAAVIGRAVGATLGRVVDQRLLGSGSEVVETGRIDRLRLTGAGEGTAIPRLWGRMRLAGHVIWASPFREHVRTRRQGGGKGGPSITTREYSYTVSLALALCEGEILRVGRVWADGEEIAIETLAMRVYPGSETQLPDPLIAAAEGEAPAFRGTAYVVIEDLDLSPWGNRVPQLSFEVVRRAGDAPGLPAAGDLVRGVALIPGTGEYALATRAVHLKGAPGEAVPANVHTPTGRTDLLESLDQLRGELPGCGSVNLVVSWFGDDLRAGACRVRPLVERKDREGREMPWRVAGLDRASAGEVPAEEGRPLYGGTPADASVVEAIGALRERGLSVVLNPFLLMTQLEGNGLPDPWGGSEQPRLPWRGRITCSIAPGLPGSPDGTSAADAEIAAFFGNAQPGDFAISGGEVVYTGPEEWSWRRFVLHMAWLARLAGGVDGFLLGSELRGLTQVRGADGGFPAVEALRTLAADVCAVLGPEVRIGYAADWSEYFGYQPQDGSGDVFFHLDPLWADDNIDFIGIDNYMPLSDWRDGTAHADSHWGSIYNLDYLRANLRGGEYFDWYYRDAEARRLQIRTPIRDGAHGEDWIYRPKDILNWWRNPHHERRAGQRESEPTAWIPESKPIWFMEVGCPAVDKGPNEPAAFVDPKSSESRLPHFSDGRRDDLVQAQYLRAIWSFWDDPDNNPLSSVYGGRMVDVARIHAWAWDARPWPAFPDNEAAWSDAPNYARGHWLNGRLAADDAGRVLGEISARAGVDDVEVAEVHALVRGLLVERVESARASCQPLLLAHGIEAVEAGGRLVFRDRARTGEVVLGEEELAITPELPSGHEILRAPRAETAGRVRLTHVEAGGSYAARVAEAIFPDDLSEAVSDHELPMAMLPGEAQATAERWLAEARLGREQLRLALPPSRLDIGPGRLLRLVGMAEGLWRVDRVETQGLRLIEASRVEPSVALPSAWVEEPPRLAPFVPPVPVTPVFMDLPLLTGAEVPHAPHIAVTATPWPGTVAVYDGQDDADYALNRLIEARAGVGITENPLLPATAGRWDRGPALRVRIPGAELSSRPEEAVLAGANAAAIGDGSPENWEILQFREARLVAPQLWELSLRLRGQAGTEHLATRAWPAGSTFVLLDGAPVQLEMAPSLRNMLRHWRVGPAARPVDDPSYEHLALAFRGIGLRPWSPVHLRAREAPDGGLEISWLRRTRVCGDDWEIPDVPLAEEREVYLVRVERPDGTLLREATVSEPRWNYPASARAADGLPAVVRVAQVSAVFGPGVFATLELG